MTGVDVFGLVILAIALVLLFGFVGGLDIFDLLGDIFDWWR